MAIYCGLSHIGGPSRMSLLCHRLLMLQFLTHNRPHCQVETHSLIMFNITITVRDAEFFRATGFLSIYVVVVLSSVTVLCALVWHCVGHNPYLPSRQSGKSTLPPTPTPPCQQQSMPPCSANGNSQPTMPFQCYPVNCPLPPCLPPEPMQRGLQPCGTTCYMVTTGFLHPVKPQAPLPAGYPAN